MAEQSPSLQSVLARVPDPRHARGRRHPWSALLLLLLVVALLCGANSQHAMARWGQHAGWARLRRLGFTRRGGPSQPTRQLGQAHRTRRVHGCVEARTRWAAAAPADFGFPFARQVLRLHCRVVQRSTGVVRHDETRDAVTSLGPDQAGPTDLLHLWQTHWQIENGVHRVRDMVFGEDAATTRAAHVHQALAVLRNLALSLLHLWHGSAVTAAREDHAAHVGGLFRRLRLTQCRL